MHDPQNSPEQPLRGQRLGDRRVRARRPYAPFFRYVRANVFEARPDEPTGRVERVLAKARRVLFGRALPSSEELGERLPGWLALPVFSSDAMSSVAYGPEAVLYTLLAAGTAAFVWLMPIMGIILVVLTLITVSYRQTIKAYPGGGGSYIVAHANLGVLPGLTAAAALLTDYVMTVAVSVSAGVFALASAFPIIHGFRVELIVISILIVMAVNLRGLRESGAVFALPTYIFLGSTMLTIAIGLVRLALGQQLQVTGVEPAHVPVEALGVLLVMRAFADGGSALTGTEAVANGVPAFRPPEWKNAQQTMLMMSLLLGTMLVGIAYLALRLGALPSEAESVLSQVTRTTVGMGPLYYVLQLSTMGILIIAAQTSFADFPRVASILAKDGYFPRQFSFQGERLAFNNGIVVLAAISVVLVVAFEGNVEALIPLYAIGVYTAFTLSQAGMVRHWFTERGPGWRRTALFNGLGALATGVVALVFGIAKFALGAWIIILVVPILVAAMLFVKGEYDKEAREIELRREDVAEVDRRRRVIVTASALNRAVMHAIAVAHSMSADVEVVHVTADPVQGEAFRDDLQAMVPEGVHVVTVESPYRSLVRPFMRYIEASQQYDPDEELVVLIPEHFARHWWDRFLYNQNAHRLRARLVGRKGVTVIDVPYSREAPRQRRRRRLVGPEGFDEAGTVLGVDEAPVEGETAPIA